MQITVNGQVQQVPDGTSLLDLLESMKMDRRQVAVEVNRELVRRELHADCRLRTGDQLEIVRFVGGG